MENRVPRLLLKSLILAGLIGVAVWQSLIVMSRSRPTAVESATVSATSEIAVGDSVADISLERLGNSPTAETISLSAFTRHCALLYFFDPGCHACVLGVKHWADYDVSMFPVPTYWISIGGSTDSVRQLISDNRLNMPVYMMKAQSGVQRLRLAAVPSAWLVSAGHLLFKDRGALSPSPESLVAHQPACPSK